jgi:hypothetical protein
MSVWTCQPTTGKAAEEIVPPRSRIPWWKGLCADSGEKHAPASDPDAAKVDSLKALDPTGRLEKRTSAKASATTLLTHFDVETAGTAALQ